LAFILVLMELKRSVKNKAKVEGSIWVAYLVVGPHTFVLTISKTTCCCLTTIRMKHIDKVKHVTQHY